MSAPFFHEGKPFFKGSSPVVCDPVCPPCETPEIFIDCGSCAPCGGTSNFIIPSGATRKLVIHTPEGSGQAEFPFYCSAGWDSGGVYGAYPQSPCLNSCCTGTFQSDGYKRYYDPPDLGLRWITAGMGCDTTSDPRNPTFGKWVFFARVADRCSCTREANEFSQCRPVTREMFSIATASYGAIKDQISCSGGTVSLQLGAVNAGNTFTVNGCRDFCLNHKFPATLEISYSWIGLGPDDL